MQMYRSLQKLQNVSCLSGLVSFNSFYMAAAFVKSGSVKKKKKKRQITTSHRLDQPAMRLREVFGVAHKPFMCDGYKADFSICAANTKKTHALANTRAECSHYIGLDIPMHSKFVTTTLNKTGLDNPPLELYCFMDVTSVLDASFNPLGSC